MHEAVAKMKATRVKRALGLRDLELQIGVSFSTLARYERGAPPSPKQLKKILDWLEYDSLVLPSDMLRLQKIEHWAKFVVLNFVAEDEKNVAIGIRKIASALATKIS